MQKVISWETMKSRHVLYSTDFHFVHTAAEQNLQTHLDAILKTSVAQAAGEINEKKNVISGLTVLFTQ